MTEAGWTSEKPTVAGWYFYKDEDGFIDVVAVRRVDSYGGPNLHEVVITVEKTTAVYQKNLHSKVSDLDGEWLGPITPDSYQQGRVAGIKAVRRKITDLLARGFTDYEEDMDDLIEWTDFQLAQQAQEGGVGDVHQQEEG